MKLSRLAGGAAMCALTFLGARADAAALNLTSTTYTQNFDTLASTGTANNTLPNGWAISTQTYRAGTGSANNGGVYSFGIDGDRALGSVASGTTGTIQYGAFFTNGTGTTITSIALSYFAEQWRRGSTIDPDGLTFSYSLNATTLANGTWTDVGALSFVSPFQDIPNNQALNGNVAGNRALVDGSIGSLSLGSGATFAIRWTDMNNGLNDDGLAIDNLTLTTQSAVPEPATWAMFIGGFGMVGGALRRRRRTSVRFA